MTVLSLEFYGIIENHAAMGKETAPPLLLELLSTDPLAALFDYSQQGKFYQNKNDNNQKHTIFLDLLGQSVTLIITKMS